MTRQEAEAALGTNPSYCSRCGQRLAESVHSVGFDSKTGEEVFAIRYHSAYKPSFLQSLLSVHVCQEYLRYNASK